MSGPTFRTKRLHLRLIQDADVDFILEGLSDTRVTQYYAVHYDTLEAVQEQMQFYRDLLEKGTGIWWAFSLEGESKLIGACGLSSLDKVHQKAEIGFWLLPAYWGKGYIPEAVAAILPYCFEVLQLNRIEAIVEGENIASAKVLEKVGFRNEGNLRESEFKNGKFIDLLYFSLLKKEFAPA